jgi:hypothetical protein
VKSFTYPSLMGCKAARWIKNCEQKQNIVQSSMDQEIWGLQNSIENFSIVNVKIFCRDFWFAGGGDANIARGA